MSSGNRADVCFFVLCALRLLPLALSLKPQPHKDFLRRREGQTTHYGLRKILHCAATKATLVKNYRLVWATKLLLAATGLVFPALVLGYNFFIVESMTDQFLYSLKNVYDYRWQQKF